VHLTSGIVVGIEQISVLRVDRRIVGQSFFEDEGLKKPAGVREMPFCRTHFGNSLDDAILRLKRFAKAFAQFANATIGRAQVVRRFAWLIPGCSGRSSRRSYWKGRHDQDFRKKEGLCQR
jgi:hypothetical protein